MYYLSHYVLKPERITSLEDVKRVLAAMNLAWEPDCDITQFKHLVELEKKPPVRAVPL